MSIVATPAPIRNVSPIPYQLPLLPELESPVEVYLAGWELLPDGRIVHGPVVRVEPLFVDADTELEGVGEEAFFARQRGAIVRQHLTVGLTLDGDGSDVLPALRPWPMVIARAFFRERQRVVQFVGYAHGYEITMPRKSVRGEWKQKTRFNIFAFDLNDCEVFWAGEPRQLSSAALALEEVEA